MCGIAGVMMVGRDAPPAEQLSKLASAMAHRGPDGRREYRNANVGLVHLRLAIIDLATGVQPLFESGHGDLHDMLDHVVTVGTHHVRDCTPFLSLHNH